MVKIPNDIKEFIEEQGIFAVGTMGVNNLPNVSPRIFFRVDEDNRVNPVCEDWFEQPSHAGGIDIKGRGDRTHA